MDSLRSRYMAKKKKIEDFYVELIDKSKNIEQVLEEFKFKVWEVLSKIGIGKHAENSNFELEVGKQVICVNMSELTKVNVRTFLQRDFEKLNHKLSKL